MGQKVSPHGLRVGVIQDWDSKWYADKNNFADYLVEDNQVRSYVKKKLYHAGISKVLIERAAENKIKVIILTSNPGIVQGRNDRKSEDGKEKAKNGIVEIKNDIAKMTGKDVDVSIVEVRRAELDAQLTAESIAAALERRVSFRRAMKQAIGRTMKAGAKGIKVTVSGRLGGAEIARSEKYSEGNVPLHTLRANIDYGFAEADTTYGKIGVKVWINHGEILDKGLVSPIPETKEGRDGRGGKRRGNRGNRKYDGNRNGRRGNRDEEAKPKAVNPRVRKTPKAAKPVEEAPEAAPEAAETEEA